MSSAPLPRIAMRAVTRSRHVGTMPPMQRVCRRCYHERPLARPRPPLAAFPCPVSNPSISFLSRASFSIQAARSSSSSVSAAATESYDLGNAHYEGRGGVERSYKKALIHYTDAASKGHSGAATRLGVMYLTGYGVARSLPTAVSFFTEAATAKEPSAEAQLHLASIHHQGLGVPRDSAKAVALYRQAAEGGNERAQVLLAKLLVRGDGVSKDYHHALRLCETAVHRGDKEAQYITALLLSHRHPYGPSPTPPPGAQSSSALFSSVPYDVDRAVALLHLASSADFVPALTALADHYAALSPPQSSLAASLYSQAADLTSTYAHSRLGFMLYHGVGVEAEPARALVSLATAGEAGRVEALLLMMHVAWERGGRDEGGRVGKVGLRVREVMEEYAGKCVDGVERGGDEWSGEERRLMARLKEEPQVVVGWIEAYEKARGEKWLGDVHQLLAVASAASGSQTTS